MSKLIHISEAASLAIHSLALIAASKEPVSAARIAATLLASRNHVAKVLQHLVKYHYLDSTRGPAGGFILKIAPERITLLEVYELIEGNIGNDYCRVHFSNCPFMECVFGGIREKLTEEFRQYFQQRKISDIIKKQITTQ
jgi:Rrf2 family protein